MAVIMWPPGHPSLAETTAYSQSRLSALKKPLSLTLAHETRHVSSKVVLHRVDGKRVDFWRTRKEGGGGPPPSYLSGSTLLFASIRVKKTGTIAALRCFRVCPLMTWPVHLYTTLSSASNTFASR